MLPYLNWRKGVLVTRSCPAAVAALAASCVAFGQTYTIATFAGGGLPANIAGTSATSASLFPPGSVAVDATGNVFFADEYVVLRLDATGLLTLVAGNGTPGYSGDGGLATSAQLNYPDGVAVDASGNVYIADTDNHCIRKVSNGTISTVAGNGTPGFSGDNGPATGAQLNYPAGIAVDSNGDLYIADTYNQRIRKVTFSNGLITTVAGNGTATSAQLNHPNGVAVDASGNVYIADTYNHCIRKVSFSDGKISTVAGNGTPGFSGDKGAATSAQLYYPEGIAVDSRGNLYIADTNNNRIRMVSFSNGTITTVAGSGGNVYSGDGGAATSAPLNAPPGVAVDSAGNLYIADYNNRIRRVSTGGAITTVAGGASAFGDGGSAIAAELFRPYGAAVDAAGNLYIAESGNSRIRMVSKSNGDITTVAGNGTKGFGGDNGPATSAQLNNPYGVAVDSFGNLYIADSGNSRIRMVANGVITTVAGGGSLLGDGLAATSAQLIGPDGVAVDSAGRLYIADSGNARVCMVSNGVIVTVAGNATQHGYSGDGGPATGAQLSDVTGVAVDSAGNLYIGDTENNRIRKVSNGVIATVAGDGACCYNGDNVSATSAELNNPAGVVAVDASGNLYVADLYNDRIRVLTPSGLSCPASVVTPLAVSAPASGGSFSLTIQTVASCAWAVQTLPNWIAISGSAVGSGPGSITLTVSVNLSGPQTAVISIAGVWVTVSQSGATAAPAPVLESPANGAMGVSPTPTLTWSASTGATSYDVYFGASATPPLLTNTTSLNYSPSTLNAGTTYYWAIAARNGIGATTSAVWSFTTGCASPLNPPSATAGSGTSTGSEPVTATMACGWAAVSNVPWITITSGASGGYLTWITDEYSTMTPFNSDNSYTLLVHQSYFGLYDGSGAYLRDLPLEISSSSEPRWSRSDNQTIYYVHGNQLKTYDISSGAMSVVHTFSEYSVISGFGESDISLDGDHFVFAGNSESIFVYQISTDKKSPVFDAGTKPFDSLYITPDNNVIVSWLTAGTTRYTGQELFNSSMTFLRQVGHADGHKDVTSDTNGDEVLVWSNSADPTPIANCNNGIVKIRLADASQTCLLQLDWSLAVNISGPDNTGPDNSGFVYVDTYNPTNPTPPVGWAPYTNELLQVKLDGSQTLRLAHHRSRPNPNNAYNWEPRISTSRDGSRVVYNSNYDLQAIEGYPAEYSDVYLVALGSPPTGLVAGALEFPPNYNTFQPPSVGGAYADPVFNSTITRVSNALGTPDAGDSGNGTVFYSVAANIGPQRTGTITIAGQTFTVTQAASPPAVLSVSKTHAGNFTQAQAGVTYTVTVSNGASAGPVIGEVTVTETPPSGLILASMAGTGWMCPVGNACVRADSLAAGASYPPIVVTMNVAANAASPQVNAVIVSGGGAANASAVDSTIIATGYLVGDVAPYTSDAAPGFGDGIVNIVDLIQELFAADDIPGFRPAPCSDRYDAMDTYPPDTATTRGGDGVLDVRDLILELFRADNLDLSRPVRPSLGGVCRGSSGNSIGPTQVSRNAAASPRLQAIAQGALVLGRAEPYGAAEERVPVYLEARQDLVRVAVTFGLGDQQSQLRFAPTAETPPSLVQDSQLGVVVAAWLNGVSVHAGGRLLLGYVTGAAGALANLTVFGLSASGLDDNRTVRLTPPPTAGIAR